jgi:hypothetical protein
MMEVVVRLGCSRHFPYRPSYRGVRGNRELRRWPMAAVASMQMNATTACVTYVQAQVEVSFFPSNSLNFNFLVFYMRVRLDTCDFLLFFLPLTK